MIDLLPITWYLDPPIDYEYKQYILLGYLSKVDNVFLNKVVSPHLLHLERLLKEITEMDVRFLAMDTMIKRGEYIFFIGGDPNKNGEAIDEVKKIITFSKPQINSRIDFGYDVLKNNQQLLF